MMPEFKITASNIQKKYGRNTIIETISFTYQSPTVIGITGANGKGKSTLLKMISGYLSATSGSIEYSFGNKVLEQETLFEHISIVAPYLDLIDNMKVYEAIDFHLLHKSAINQLSTPDILELTYLNDHRSKLIGSLSSGMKQRLKLGLALSSQTPFILLDEPTSNLDEKAKNWFHETFRNYCKDKLVFIATNAIPEEMVLCKEFIQL
jgi:ABC-type multidrug transport system ATPase subunit